jgi:hypothetical protein
VFALQVQCNQKYHKSVIFVLKDGWKWRQNVFDTSLLAEQKTNMIFPNPTPFPGPQIPGTEPGLPEIPSSPPVPGSVPQPIPAPFPEPIPAPVPEPVPSPIPQTVPGPIPQTIPEPI